MADNSRVSSDHSAGRHRRVVGRPQPISPNISQETLAEMIGTTRSRVSFFMNKFRKLGLISYNGHIEVHNSLLNAVLHEKPQLKEDQ
jgi:CRP/FNR family transcriptional regulator, cyclic AMP receptor protein